MVAEEEVVLQCRSLAGDVFGGLSGIQHSRKEQVGSPEECAGLLSHLREKCVILIGDREAFGRKRIDLCDLC